MSVAEVDRESSQGHETSIRRLATPFSIARTAPRLTKTMRTSHKNLDTDRGSRSGGFSFRVPTDLRPQPGAGDPSTG